MPNLPNRDKEEGGGLSLQKEELGHEQNYILRHKSQIVLYLQRMMFYIRLCMLCEDVRVLTTMILKLSVLGLLLSVLWISSLWRLIPLTFTSWTRLETHSNHGNTNYNDLQPIHSNKSFTQPLRYMTYAHVCPFKFCP